ncbi:MAG: Lrp/AsnC family transcriptional regulator [candidate division WS1 bacterium]|jgi:DNA-binding Lrp family transcriptional regulator|nr:Lrp/AsnC family transcriptional regulator [candidate division WS1 bacterium]
MREKLLTILTSEGRLPDEEIAERLGLTAQEVADAIAEMEADRVILGYRALVDWASTDVERVFAYILVEGAPEHGVGFNRLAEHVARFDEVHSIHLTSGTADLTVVVEGRDFRDIARFVAEKLAPTPGVTGTSTSFVLKTYKLEGKLIGETTASHRLAVSP